MKQLIQPIKILILAIVLAIVLSIGVSYVYADWAGHTATAPSGNVSELINTSSEGQTKTGGLWLGSLGADGGATIGGSMRIGYTSAVCTAGIAGTLRYNSGVAQFCNGSRWCELGVDCAPADCNLPWGGSIPSGSSVTAYQNSSVACGGSCVSETRTCNNGTLSGSYQNASCAVAVCTGRYISVTASCSNNFGVGSCPFSTAGPPASLVCSPIGSRCYTVRQERSGPCNLRGQINKPWYRLWQCR
ncbi:MAG: pectin methylesterase ce8, nonfunctional [Candidatus Kaiserbacteria bacterium GW2011_GWA2_49_19]|uniref:Pectin methylesterase ce8, nonfunctional n=1 Tax=Candidatus Kaiserbacteria bacterium GW2011_GWA2_49_19 TaxID=1618669 RepID=A0A0G1VQC9_9BACT|nr:MAG: pectin methylesterase ce8, nonfunctional [Candidatus Kaiserbacteria bacterium GW2011_GWA2_49_19]